MKQEQSSAPLVKNISLCLKNFDLCIFIFGKFLE